MTDELFIPFKFKTSVQLSPVEVYGDINDRIKEKLKNQLEGVCSRFGFVRPNSIDVVRRSAGILLKAHFNGHVKFEVYCNAHVCNPVNGMIQAGVVVNKNQLGILAESKVTVNGRSIPVLDVIIPYRTAGIQSEVSLEDYAIGDKIFFQVVGKRSQVNDRKISVIGRGVAAPSQRSASVAVAAAAAAAVAVVSGEEPTEERDDDDYFDLEELEEDEPKVGGGDADGDADLDADPDAEAEAEADADGGIGAAKVPDSLDGFSSDSDSESAGGEDDDGDFDEDEPEPEPSDVEDD